jgi:threonyl-tRNA synthetase
MYDYRSLNGNDYWRLSGGWSQVAHAMKRKLADVSRELYSKSFSRPIVVLKHLIRSVKDLDVRICQPRAWLICC